MLVQIGDCNSRSHPQLQDPRHLRQQQDADKQFLSLAQKTFAKIGDHAVIRVQVPRQVVCSCNHA